MTKTHCTHTIVKIISINVAYQDYQVRCFSRVTTGMVLGCKDVGGLAQTSIGGSFEQKSICIFYALWQLIYIPLRNWNLYLMCFSLCLCCFLSLIHLLPEKQLNPSWRKKIARPVCCFWVFYRMKCKKKSNLTVCNYMLRLQMCSIWYITINYRYYETT